MYEFGDRPMSFGEHALSAEWKSHRPKWKFRSAEAICVAMK